MSAASPLAHPILRCPMQRCIAPNNFHLIEDKQKEGGGTLASFQQACPWFPKFYKPDQNDILSIGMGFFTYVVENPNISSIYIGNFRLNHT
jgi:hypothetical protein